MRLGNLHGFEAALQRPATYAHNQEADIALQAAVLAHGVAEGQHFIAAQTRSTTGPRESARMILER